MRSARRGRRGGGEERQTAQHQETGGAATEALTGSTTPASAQGPSAPAEPVQQPTGAIAVQEFADGKWRVSVDQLRRSGNLVMLNFTITNLNAPDWQIGSEMGQQVGDWSVGGVSLIDSINANGTGRAAPATAT